MFLVIRSRILAVLVLRREETVLIEVEIRWHPADVRMHVTRRTLWTLVWESTFSYILLSTSSIIKMLIHVTLHSCCNMIKIILWLWLVFKFPPNSEIQWVQEYKDEEQVVVLRCGEDGIEAVIRGHDQSTCATVTWSLASSCSHSYFGLGCTV